MKIKQLTLKEFKVQFALGSIEDVWKLTKSKRTSPDILEELYFYADQYEKQNPYDFRMNILTNPKLSSKTLQRVYDYLQRQTNNINDCERWYQLIGTVLRHPNLPRSIIDKNLKTIKLWPDENILLNPSLTHEDLKNAVQNIGQHRFILQNKNCPDDILVDCLNYPYLEKL